MKAIALSAGIASRGEAPRGEGEPVGDTAAGEGVEAQIRELRAQAQRALEPAGSGLEGEDLPGAGGVAGRGQGDGHRLRAGQVRVQPEPGVPAGDVAAAQAPALARVQDVSYPSGHAW